MKNQLVSLSNTLIRLIILIILVVHSELSTEPSEDWGEIFLKKDEEALRVKDHCADQN